MDDSSGPRGGHPEPRPVNPPSAAALPSRGEPVSGQRFRDALARVPSPVVVIATDGIAGPAGFTATAFASVSDDPPIILVCLNRKSAQNAVFEGNGVFTVNMLGGSDRAVAETFAGFTGRAGAERFEPHRWTRLATGAPALVEARMVLDCRLSDIVPVATHNVIYGHVVSVEVSEPTSDGNDVLLYHDRRFRSI